MKKINNIIYLFILAIVFVSCENDINSSAEGEFTATNEVTIGFTDTNNNLTLLEDGGTVTFNVALSKGLPVDATVELGVSSSDGSLNNGGVSEVAYSTATINAGSTTASFTLTFADDMLPDNLETYNITIGNLTTSSALTEHYITVSAEQGAFNRVVTIVDSLPIEVTTTAGVVTVTMDWGSAVNDLDLYLFNGDQDNSGPFIFRSWGITNQEVAILPSNQADGYFSVYVDFYTAPTDVPITLTFDFPGGEQEVITKTVNSSNFVFSCTKTTNGADITYILTEI